MSTSTDSPLQVVSAIYDAFTARGLDSVLRVIDSSIVVTQDAAHTWGGRFEGHEQAMLGARVATYPDAT